MFLRNGRVFREPRTEWLQLEPGDSALALTGQAGLKVDDQIFHGLRCPRYATRDHRLAGRNTWNT